MADTQTRNFHRALSDVPSPGCRSGDLFAVVFVAVAVLVGPLVGSLAAQEVTSEQEQEMVAEMATDVEMGDLAKQSQNPVGSLISLPLQNNTNFDWGPREDIQNILNIQPVIPVALSKKWNLINRAIIPVVHQPEIIIDEGGHDRPR